MTICKIVFAGAAVLTMVSAARAEDVKLVGSFPAGSGDVAMLRSIAVDRFAGRDGPSVAITLERALTKPAIDGRVHFVVRPDPADADGVVQGGVSTDVRSDDFIRQVERCAERDDRDKCVRKEKVPVDCVRRVVRMTVDARVVDVRDRRVVWAGAPERSVRTEWCKGDSTPPSVATVQDRMAAELAEELRATFAPTARAYSARFRESTKGLEKAQATRFKALIRQSQIDLPAACKGWLALEGEAPDHIATIFDLGVCAEATGDLDTALRRYERASQLLGPNNEAEDDANRVRDLIVARELVARRGT